MNESTGLQINESDLGLLTDLYRLVLLQLDHMEATAALRETVKSFDKEDRFGGFVLEAQRAAERLFLTAEECWETLDRPVVDLRERCLCRARELAISLTGDTLPASQQPS